jgi:transcriptional regulator with XRE-family HTH domain
MKNEAPQLFSHNKLKTLREHRGWKQEDVAQQLGITAQLLSNYENGHCKPPTDRLLQILEFYRISHHEIMVKKS